jgi:hypothetical protein
MPSLRVSNRRGQNFCRFYGIDGENLQYLEQSWRDTAMCLRTHRGFPSHASGFRRRRRARDHIHSSHTCTVSHSHSPIKSWHSWSSSTCVSCYWPDMICVCTTIRDTGRLQCLRLKVRAQLSSCLLSWLLHISEVSRTEEEIAISA